MKNWILIASAPWVFFWACFGVRHEPPRYVSRKDKPDPADANVHPIKPGKYTLDPEDY